MDLGCFWMCNRLDQNGFVTQEHMDAVEVYISFAASTLWFFSGDRIRCPCVRCGKESYRKYDEVRQHLYYNGFCPNPTFNPSMRDAGQSSRSVNAAPVPTSMDNPYANMVRDGFFSNLEPDPNYNDEQTNTDQGRPADTSDFYTLLNDADEPLWSGCKEYTILSAVSQLLNCKSEFNMSVACFNRMNTIIKGMLPDDDKLPSNYYQMKKKMEGFGLGYKKIHVCPRNCMLFYKDTETWEHCLCVHPRYKPSNTIGNVKNRVPFKVLRYLSLIPRLQRLFMSKKTAKDMIWHSENPAPEGVLTHPSNGEAWCHFDSTYPSFAAEVRNVRLGLCTDGFNPYRHGGRPYSCWPVMIVIYNLPPWLCMKQSSILLNMVIPGPDSPSQK